MKKRCETLFICICCVAVLVVVGVWSCISIDILFHFFFDYLKSGGSAKFDTSTTIDDGDLYAEERNSGGAHCTDGNERYEHGEKVMIKM